MSTSHNGKNEHWKESSGHFVYYHHCPHTKISFKPILRLLQKAAYFQKKSHYTVLYVDLQPTPNMTQLS